MSRYFLLPAVALCGLLAAGARAQTILPAGADEPVIDNSGTVLTFPALRSPTPLSAEPALHPVEVPRSRAVKPDKPFDKDALSRASARGDIIPMWEGVATVPPNTYNFWMVGRSPFTANSGSVSVPAILFPVRFTFTKGNHVFDPTKVDKECSPKGSALTLVKQSPIVQKIVFTSNGVNIGTGQYSDLFQRASFWTQAQPGGINPAYHVKLSVKVGATLSINVDDFPTRKTPCGRQGLIDFDSVDSFFKNTVVPGLKNQGVTPKTLPIFLFYNVAMYDKGTGVCCTLGFHDAFNNPSFNGTFQTMAIANYDTSQKFKGKIADVSILSHEIAEWLDDPTVDNPTPPWGHIGQTAGCQDNLEVGDPLTPNLHPVKMNNGFTYHLQDLAFISWFYRLVGFSVNGWYTMYNKFKTYSTDCH